MRTSFTLVGFGIADNAASELYVVVEVPCARQVNRLDPLSVGAELGHEGAVGRALGQYEDRPSQRDMAAHIADGYNDGGVLLLEAGTGVGKSFAYLIPAIAWARENRERTLVSTNTINLQEQLFGKDLPFLSDAVATADYRPTFALLKGWRNYLCLARLHHAVGAHRSLLEPDRFDELQGHVLRHAGLTRRLRRWPAVSPSDFWLILPRRAFLPSPPRAG